MSFKPLLGKDADLDNIQYPVLASFKIDGIRAVGFNGCRSRNLLEFPNKHVRSLFAINDFAGLDGELILGDPFGQGVYSRTNSAVMSQDGTPDVKWYIFDDFTEVNAPYHERLASAERRVGAMRAEGLEQIIFVPHKMINNAEELTAFEAEALLLGYEGIMIRNPNNKYKYGRSTVKEGTLLKVKRFMDATVKITGAYELMSNQNEAQLDELGHTKRSSAKEGLVSKGVLGGFECVLMEDIDTGILTANGTTIIPAGTEFSVGSGFNAAQREDFWNRRNEIVGVGLATIKFFAVGIKDKPRFPIFKGLRDPVDA